MIGNYNCVQSKTDRFSPRIFARNSVDRLNAGWSSYTGRPVANRVHSPLASNINQSLRDDELQRIRKVLERAQRIELIEQERIG